MEKRSTLTVNMSEEMKRKLKIYSATEGISVSKLISRIIEEFLEKEEKEKDG